MNNEFYIVAGFCFIPIALYGLWLAYRPMTMTRKKPEKMKLIEEHVVHGWKVVVTSKDNKSIWWSGFHEKKEDAIEIFEELSKAALYAENGFMRVFGNNLIALDSIKSICIEPTGSTNATYTTYTY